MSSSAERTRIDRFRTRCRGHVSSGCRCGCDLGWRNRASLPCARHWIPHRWIGPGWSSNGAGVSLPGAPKQQHLDDQSKRPGVLSRILPSLLPIHHSIVVQEQEPELLGPRHRQGPPPLDASPRGAGSRAREGPVILYTGISSDGATTQNAAVPVDPGDAMLKHWKKIAQNPLIPAGGRVAMRDPSSAWRDSSWRILLGGENASDGVGLVYWSNDFLDGEWKRL
ncbi:uncharacterized protein LOC9634965 [Selaginella moellendorffii]|uniref:uncharacterized protein LOC9634965 n=1 Tax=Selaginella moellendorffii TaxID=88036 RepID=UPI000D1C2BEB|nr:uncharacterized protein LOC9634965 [Selaginella moellendorffii]|eukprot:XP_024526541.1 uncharacterized protein LOC9634965 [Selaginella moellendorffii]